MKLRFLTLMLPMLNFGSNSVERSRSAMAMGIQSSDFVHQIAIKAFPDDLLRRTKYIVEQALFNHLGKDKIVR